VGDLAVGLGQPGVAFGPQPLGDLVVDDPVGLDGGPVVVDLHVADRGDAMVGVVVIDLVRLDEHLRVGGGMQQRGGFWRGRPDLLAEVEELLLRGRRSRQRKDRAGKRQRHRGPRPWQARPATQVRTGCGRTGHSPSSWYSNATSPVSPPTTTGSQAAAIGCISSALLKSSVTLEKT